MGLRQVVCVGVNQVDGEQPGPCRACRTLQDNILVNALQRLGLGPTAEHTLGPTPRRVVLPEGHRVAMATGASAWPSSD